LPFVIIFKDFQGTVWSSSECRSCRCDLASAEVLSCV